MDVELTSDIDLTAMILCNMRKDSPPCSSPSSPVSSPCALDTQDTCDCTLCERGTPIILSKCHTWAWIMRVVFYSLKERYPEKKFFSLKNDVYEYMMNHWNTLGLDKKPSANWHKQIQDMLSHSRSIFESGMNHFRQNGFWRLKDLEDPWTSRPDAPRVASPPTSPKKRPSKFTNNDSDEDSASPSPPKKICTPTSTPTLLPVLVVAPLLSLPQLVESACTSNQLDQEVALLRDQLAQMTESMANLSQHDITNNYIIPQHSAPPPTSYTSSVYLHNRVWEEAFTPFASVNA